MVGDDLVQPGPVGVPTAQLAFHVLPTEPPDDRLPADAPQVDVHEGDVTCGAGSKSCVVAALFSTLVSDDPSDLSAAGVKEAHDTLFDGRKHDICRENDLVSLPQCRSGRKWGAGIGESRGRGGIPLSSRPWWDVWGVLGPRFLFSASGFLDQAVDDLDSLSTDSDSFAANRVCLCQGGSRQRLTEEIKQTKLHFSTS